MHACMQQNLEPRNGITRAASVHHPSVLSEAARQALMDDQLLFRDLISLCGDGSLQEKV